MQCVGRRLLWCPCGVDFCDRGATLVAARETQRLPALRGSNQRAAAPATLFRPPGRPCRKESQTFGLIPFRILWIASAVGCQSTHARLRSSSRGGQPALASTSAPGARDHCRATRPRVYKSSWNPRPLQSNQPPCLQKPLEPETTKGNRPPCLQKFLDLDPSEATGPRVWNRSFCPRPQRATRTPCAQKQFQSWTTWGQPVPQESRSPRLVKKKLDYPSRHALRNVRMKFNGIRDIKDNQSPCLRESDDLDAGRQLARTTPIERLTTPLENFKKKNKEELHEIRIHVNNEMEEIQKMTMSTYSNAVGKHVQPRLYTETPRNPYTRMRGY